MNIAITAGVTAGITESGVLTLMSPHGAPYFYAPEASAIWIALRQSGGDVHAAAAELAAACEVDVREAHQLIEQYVTVWQQAGLVCTSIVPGSG
ncbi:PqqD family peptide modification chaperone [Streptomyces sp. NPDC006602]|uniref:PqqD family peptide modification chaperone n=1 Tax=Streptomyces sp. NPDC006602 TaxID=3364751 RepID=UPI0036C1D2AB